MPSSRRVTTPVQPRRPLYWLRNLRELDSKVCVRNLHTAHFSLSGGPVVFHRSRTSPKVPNLHHHEPAAVWRRGGGHTKSGGLPKCRMFRSPPAPRRATISTSPRPRIV